jgi:hypothetical protein
MGERQRKRIFVQSFWRASICGSYPVSRRIRDKRRRGLPR